MKSKHFIALACVATTAATAQITVLVDDDFTYPDGALTDNANWTRHQGNQQVIQVSSGSISVQQTNGNPEDVNLQFTPQNAAILTATFDMSVSDNTRIGGGDYEYFAHFMNSGGSETALLDIVPSITASGDFSIGIATNSSTAEAVLAADLSYNTTYTVTLSFDFGSGIASAVVQGKGTISSTTAATGLTLDQLALRQANSSNDELITIYNLTVASVPEPSVFAFLGGLLGLGWMSVRRRR